MLEDYPENTKFPRQFVCVIISDAIKTSALAIVSCLCQYMDYSKTGFCMKQHTLTIDPWYIFVDDLTEW